MLNEDPDPERAAAALAERFGIPAGQAFDDVVAIVREVGRLSVSRGSRIRRPTIRGCRAVARSWWRQHWRYRVLIVEVTLVVIAIEIGLKLSNIARLARAAGVPLATHHAAPPIGAPDDLSSLCEHEQRVYWAVCWVMDRWLYDGTCLRRALAFGWFLRRRHPVLRLGMLDEHGTVAHAWIEVEGVAFGAQSVTRAFATPRSPSRGSPVPVRDSAAPLGGGTVDPRKVTGRKRLLR